MEGANGRTARRLAGLCAITLAALVALPAAASAQVKAGAAAVDASWHVGASAGQYASDGTPVGEHGIDPTTHSTKRAASYGIQSRLSARALVIEGPNGQRVALVKNDLYIPQDLLYRRVAQLLEAKPQLRIGRHNLTMAVTHNHSSPYYSSPSWGVWAFQDVFDVRFYDYYSRRMAAAVEQAATHLVPVRVGASVNYFDKTHRHSFGGAVADDGSPAGYPVSDADHDMTVVRFDDISNPRRPRPLANLVNFSLHPEFLPGNDLISGDYVAPLQRMVDRRTGAVTIYTQSSVGTGEIEKGTYHSVHERLEFDHNNYAQAEYGARLMAGSILDAWADIARRKPHDPSRFIPFTKNFPVAMFDRFFPGPASHPYPGVSSCRTDPAFAGDPRIPVIGLPDCQSARGILSDADIFGVTQSAPLPPVDPGVTTDDFERAGIPVPENYSAISYTGLEENLGVHLQGIRLGDIFISVCSCEQWADQSRNIKTRTNRKTGDEYHGFDWGKRVQTPSPDIPHPKPGPYCTRLSDGKWDCPNPSRVGYLGRLHHRLPPLDDKLYRRFRAQVNNNAAGWNDTSNTLQAESEPDDPAKVKGNFTHGELPPRLGYKLTIALAMANDYNGYIASYREYQRGDHYRKALTGWGPHSMDYMSSRLVAIGGFLNGGPAVPAEPLDSKEVADIATSDARAQALGNIGATSLRSYEAALPNDGGPVMAIEQPSDIQRFATAFFSWNGGSNFTDNPQVVVQRRVGSRWESFADQTGEIPVTLRYPQGEDVPEYLSGGFRWRWTAHFEAFVSRFDLLTRPRATPAGTYRFVVDGLHRQGGRGVPYRLVSREFRVRPWNGITVDDLRVTRNGTVSYRVGPRHSFVLPSGEARQLRSEGSCRGDARYEGLTCPALKSIIGPVDYPDSYKSPIRFIGYARQAIRDPLRPTNPRSVEWYCITCSFRPWADSGDAKTGYVTVVRVGAAARSRTVRRIRAVRHGDRWYARASLCRGQVAFVNAGDVRDPYGNLNGSASRHIAGGRRACASGRRRTAPRRRRPSSGPRFTG